ncbi:MAG TPA: DNA polymerase III subunit beta, partial [Paludibacteraceae bacterium]|nr:DNA polymerase III subunit beta [Paludibacteraceae bacterium]
MEFVVSSTELLNRLQTISRVINPKNALQILDNFLFELKGNTLTVVATDIETTLITSLEVINAKGSGRVAITSRLLLDTLREFSEQPLTFSINDTNLSLTILSANGTYNFIGQNADEYPRIPEIDEENSNLVVPGVNLFSGISKTLFASVDDDFRPVMSGIYFDIVPEGLTIVATDAHKLVRFKTIYTSASLKEEAMSFILPKKPANLLKNILPKESGDVLIKFDEKRVLFQLSNYTLIGLQIEGRYPNYNAVIPTSNPYKVIIDRVNFLNAIKRVSIFSNQASNLIKLVFENQQVHISAQDIDFSISAEEVIPCQFEGETFTIGFKATFLIEILSSLDSSEVIIELSDPTHGALFFPFEKKENEEVVM